MNLLRENNLLDEIRLAIAEWLMRVQLWLVPRDTRDGISLVECLRWYNEQKAMRRARKSRQHE